MKTYTERLDIQMKYKDDELKKLQETEIEIIQLIINIITPIKLLKTKILV